jgi:FtsZ-binding cell division protein ZapB
MLLHIPIL